MSLKLSIVERIERRWF